MQNKYPQKPGLDFILKQAFFYWNKTLIFQLMFSIMYFGILMTVFFFCDSKYGIMSQYIETAKYAKDGMQVYTAEIQKMLATDSFQNFSLWIIGATIFLYPLNLGFYQIYRKIDLGEKPELSDLFVGYNGLNFFKYIGYYIFWYFIFAYTIQTVILGVLWVCLTIFVAPMMFFMNKTIFEAISLNFKALKMYFLEIFVCVIVAIFFKYIGFALFLVGGLFTFPFWNAMIYSLYKTVFSEKN
ncbi:hypothetical protein J3D55_000527 [Chryseobacterium ginsenosidimutans]|uniref:hypothetical protein n=1 Tax=Chryseobacterium ginsenosidimutans TaxID=687846 RepID=UPI00216A311D|nr:hypothetical protein [Chryseobacterium ginsenosidimutans]MCS3867611.1 hypothetical protein [Chryseobacterium ginsenosidimutans]